MTAGQLLISSALVFARQSSAGFTLMLALLSMGIAGKLTADSLAGKVLDPQGSVVVKADLSLSDRTSGVTRKTTSSGTGEYTFQNIPPGTYLVSAETEGATLKISEDVTVAGEVQRDLTLSIASAAVRVVVTATATPLSEQEIAKVLDVVDEKEINLRNEFSLSEAVRNVPGVRVKQLGGPGSLTTIKTRGMRNQDTAVLVDGLRFRDAASTQGDATAFLSDMTMVDTARVEYLRGSGASLYGTNAMAGVININSNTGGGQPHGSFRAEGGGLGMIRGVANLGGGLAEDKFVYSGGFSHLNVMDGIRGKGPYRNSSGQVFAKYNFSPKLSISGRFWGADAFLRSETGPSFPASITANFPATGIVQGIPLPDDQLALAEQRLPFAAGNATFVPSFFDPLGSRLSNYIAASTVASWQMSSNWSSRTSYQAVDTNRNHKSGTVGGASHFDGRTDTVQQRLDGRAGNKNLITAGYEFENEKYADLSTDETAASPNTSTRIQQRSSAIFGQDQIRLLDGQLQIAVSGRTQFFQVSDPQFTSNSNSYAGVKVDSPPNAYTGDISVAYFIRNSGTKLRGHIGNSYRQPASYERFGSFLSVLFGNSFFGDPRLKPEKATAMDGGIDQWLMNSKVRVSATYFYTNLRESIIFLNSFPASDPFGRLFGGFANSNRGGIARGVELSTQISPTSRTNVQVAYTFTNADQRTPTVAGTTYHEILGTSRHVFTIMATQWITRSFNVTFDLFAASDYIVSPFGASPRLLNLPGPVKPDVVFNYNVPLGEKRSIEFYGKLENFINNRYYEDGFRSPGFWGIGGIKFNF